MSHKAIVGEVWTEKKAADNKSVNEKAMGSATGRSPEKKPWQRVKNGARVKKMPRNVLKKPYGA